MNTPRHKHWDDENINPNDFITDEDSVETMQHRRKIRKTLEDRLERKRLREELDEFDGDFDWDEMDR